MAEKQEGGRVSQAKNRSKESIKKELLSTSVKFTSKTTRRVATRRHAVEVSMK